MRAILFDLDGTLLDIDIDAFLRKYFQALTQALSAVVDNPDDVPRAMQGILGATNRMMEPHPGLTNREVFVAAFRESAGIDLEEHREVFDAFYEDVFPGLGTGLGPRQGAHEAWDSALEGGHIVAVATNPIFPARAIEHRLAWAGVDVARAAAVTTYEFMTAAKPHAEYYRQTAEMLELDPSECMMVGDDAVLDMAAADVGMKTFYVGADPSAIADYRGDMLDVADLIRRMQAG
jgi:FMN phosphatase YigB (HAD superfamily)